MAKALAALSERWWYLPKEFLPTIRELGISSGTDERQVSVDIKQHGLIPEAGGRLYFSNHVSNEQVAYWDFSSQRLSVLPFRAKFDGRLTVCRRGNRIGARRYGHSGSVDISWVYVFDVNDGNLTESERFQVQGAIYELRAEEDGNHLLFCLDREGVRTAVRCLANGTQREELPTIPSAGLYDAQPSRSGRLVAAGPAPLRIYSAGVESVSFPHFYAQSFVWSPDERSLAFFGRRWRDTPPDFL